MYGNFFYYIDNDFCGFVVWGGYLCYVFLDFVFVYVNCYWCVIGVVDVWFVCGVWFWIFFSFVYFVVVVCWWLENVDLWIFWIWLRDFWFCIGVGGGYCGWYWFFYLLGGVGYFVDFCFCVGGGVFFDWCCGVFWDCWWRVYFEKNYGYFVGWSVDEWCFWFGVVEVCCGSGDGDDDFYCWWCNGWIYESSYWWYFCWFCGELVVWLFVVIF